MELADKQVVNVLAGSTRPTLFCDVLVRVADTFAREMHLDVDEGNAAALKNGDAGLVIGDIGLPKINNM
jgi:putative phosphotransacetylase